MTIRGLLRMNHQGGHKALPGVGLRGICGMLGLAMAVGLGSVAWAQSQEPRLEDWRSAPLQAELRHRDAAPVVPEQPQPPQRSLPDAVEQPTVITGKVQTLQQAIESERGYVDWYAWYLAARAYLDRTGGLQCPVGSVIRFHKGGRLEASSVNPFCRASVARRFFPLPRQTRLETLVLPVRDWHAPPASPQELWHRVRQQGETD